jgi:hypothetical protein
MTSRLYPQTPWVNRRLPSKGKVIMRFSGLTVIAAFLFSACTPAAKDTPAGEAPAPTETSPPVTVEVPVPRESLSDMHAANCTWGEVVSAGVSIWSYACPDKRLVPDETLPGFQREDIAADGTTTRSPVIQFYTKSPDAPIGAVIDAVRAASPGSENCEITAGSDGDFVLMPTGENALAYSRFLSGEAEEPSMPCGPLGPSEGGSRTFRVLADAPDKVIMIDWGTEPPVYDPDTMRAAK